jgi:hypothetical protein
MHARLFSNKQEIHCEGQKRKKKKGKEERKSSDREMMRPFGSKGSLSVGFLQGHGEAGKTLAFQFLSASP